MALLSFVNATRGPDPALPAQPPSRPHFLDSPCIRGEFMAATAVSWISAHFDVRWHDVLDVLLRLPEFSGLPDTWDRQVRSPADVAHLAARVGSVLGLSDGDEGLVSTLQ